MRDVSEYEDFKEILNNEKMESLFEMLEGVNPLSAKKAGKNSGDDFIDI
ncbi:MAG: hypothetical protein NTV15_05975 [Candidatus Bathyarchaeota archaeon]|nr:hypothetical protein [Candidatus Bathyarchaeota archaeon]